MRVIEPRAFQYNKPLKKPKSRKRKFVVVLFAVSALIIVFIVARLQHKPVATVVGDTLGITQPADSRIQAANALAPLRNFTGEEFQELYNVVAYPNVTALTEPPTITGNKVVDTRIRQVAESRGYRLRSVPVAPISKSNEPGLREDDLLQEKAFAAWNALKDAAGKENIPLQLNSGYRSVDMQRRLFLARLNATGITYDQIVRGEADNQILSVLFTTAPPGYSRHHTGYTIDLKCGNVAGQAFKQTACFTWLSKNNYENAKKLGWVPSYPHGLGQQGPEPEPWEYVWVGQEMLKVRQ